jgi:hypothetical protein
VRIMHSKGGWVGEGGGLHAECAFGGRRAKYKDSGDRDDGKEGADTFV